MDITSLIDKVYTSRNVSSCIIITQSREDANKVSTVARHKLYPSQSDKFTVIPRHDLPHYTCDIQQYELVIAPKAMPDLDYLFEHVKEGTTLILF